MALYGGITLPGQPDLANIGLLDRSILPALNRYSRIGIAIDIPYLNELSVQFGAEMLELQQQIASYIPKHALDQFCIDADTIDAQVSAVSADSNVALAFNASSHPQIRALVFGLLAVGRDKKLKSTDTGLVSTGRKNLDTVREEHPVIPLVIAYRERAKLKSAFADSLPSQAQLHPAGRGQRGQCAVCELTHENATHRLHTTFTTTRAITGRLSSKEPNLQQIPVRSKLGGRIRAAFIASAGCKLVSVDFSQMEIRDLAHLSNAESMIEIYRNDGDIHLITAMDCFHIADPSKVDKYLHRLPAKRTGFGIQNGTTGKGLHAQLVMDYWNAGMRPPSELDQLWCDDFIRRWHSRFPEVQPYFDDQYYRARRYGFVWNPWGRVRYIPQVRSALPWKAQEGLREAQNFAVTSSNAEQTKLAMWECEDTFDNIRSGGLYVEGLLSIHDQIIAECQADIADDILAATVSIFDNVMVDRDSGIDDCWWRCPIKGDGEILDRWKDKQ